MTMTAETDIVKQEFKAEYAANIKRKGSKELLGYLENETDFFTAPASTRFHGAYPGGLARHSLNVFKRLAKYIDDERRISCRMDYDNESIAIVALLHDICKANYYKETTRNVKNEQTGIWEKVPFYTVEDAFPYGHGEKSAYIASRYMTLTDDEAMAIRWHMGFSNTEDRQSVGRAFELFPLALALSTADMEATYFCEGCA